MGKRMGRYTVVMERKPAILGYAAICGKKESEGPLGAAFDLTYEDTTLGEKSWEKAESRLQKEAVNCAMKKAGAVSYTHLDVYKRQGWLCCRPSCFWINM